MQGGLTTKVCRLFFITVSSLSIAACASKHNTVRYNAGIWSLSTEHYLSVDEDKVLELDKGERTIAFELKRGTQEEITVTVRLYDTDKGSISRMRIVTDGQVLDFPSLIIQREIQSEAVTVLDSGQRREENPNLTGSAQPQTGYITFGKPSSAGVAKRYWISYRFRISPQAEMRAVVVKALKISVLLDIGPNLGEAQLNEKQLRAWRKYFSGEYDERNGPE